MENRAAKMPHVTCPACGGRAFARSIGKNSELYRELYYHCRNPDACGHEFVVEMAAVRTVKRSRFPNPLAILPLSSWRGAANDDAANDDAANDDPGLEHGRPAKVSGAAAIPSAPGRYEFTCAGCETVEYCPTPVAPEGWIFAGAAAARPHCGDCAPKAIAAE